MNEYDYQGREPSGNPPPYYPPLDGHPTEPIATNNTAFPGQTGISGQMSYPGQMNSPGQIPPPGQYLQPGQIPPQGQPLGSYSQQAFPQPPVYPQQQFPPPPPTPPQSYYTPYYQQLPPPPQQPPSPPIYPVFYQPVDEKKGMAIASMILGIVALVFFCVTYISVPLAIASVVLGCFAIKSTQSKGMAIAGIVCGGAALLMLLFFFGAALFDNMWLSDWFFYDW